MGVHVFGVKVNGQRARLSGTFDDAKFQALTAKGLPNGWFAWHFEDGETVNTSIRAKMVYDLPVVIGRNPYWCTIIPAGHAMAEPHLREFLRTGYDYLINFPGDNGQGETPC